MARNAFSKNDALNLSRLPSFFIIGPPRTGTTWLHTVLSQCAWLADPTKETRFFDKHFDRGLEWYRSHYRKATDERAIGEIAPTYFSSQQARERIAQLIPHAKIVCTFRDPVDRVISLYRLKRAYGFIRWTLEEALERDPELLESSRYASHLKEWKKALGESQVLVMLHDDIEKDAQLFLDTVADFIGTSRVNLVPTQLRRVLSSEELREPRNYYWTRGAMVLSEWAKAQRLDSVVAFAKRLGAVKFFVGGGVGFQKVSYCERMKLRKLFRAEVEALEAMVGRDLSGWK
ncbi:MAG TPA: sulfotransferase [Candidatus Sulfotelmatobacter sp.]|nr:sulfotransferase [Candidatus Sulfotelmatobacter sp.]